MSAEDLPADEPAAPPARTRTSWAVRRREPDRFALVLTLLVTAYVLSALGGKDWVQVVVAVLYVGALFVAIRSSRVEGRARIVIRAIPLAAAVVSLAAFVALPRQDAYGVLNAAVATILVTALVVILDRILRRSAVTLQSIFGALSAYLLIGMIFTAVFGVLAWLGPSPFFAGGQEVSQRALQYFSYTTLTTLGYGDYTAAEFPGRNIATFEALVGQIFLATLVARLVASFTVTPRRSRLGTTIDTTSPDAPGE
ncbi:potassium channel family protein [Cellulomonas sp. URHD0024]|uniref:potassium channel family protein n=1 Tax=Cellulomonas sp. URHD0024 TaxID=1302620 RepID=UPI0003FB67BC|nr:potassium channel family protein [Cellulomonas sp. URHD0024]